MNPKQIFLCTSIMLGFLPLESFAHRPQDFVAEVRGKKDEGQQIVAHFCQLCHAPEAQISLGAPRQGMDEDWKLRVMQGREVLLLHTQDGIGAMPARGGCFECSDLQLQLAILALLPQDLKEILQQKTKKPGKE